jgi:NADH dehydrogenase [ubiquinone] 1 alpha subcomplex assembly factor 1
MKITLLLLMPLVLFNPHQQDPLINFGSTSKQTKDWVLLSDNVMGGVTTSKLAYTENTLVLTGSISLENYGGFSSVKSKFGRFNLSDYTGVKIRYKASNQKFAFTLEDSQNWTQPNYKGDFSDGEANSWVETTIFFNDFKQFQIGRPTGDMLLPSTLERIVRLGIITTEKKEGPFSIEIDYIEFIR